MLGGSSYFSDVYLVYYGINVSEFQVARGRGEGKLRDKEDEIYEFHEKE